MSEIWERVTPCVTASAPVARAPSATELAGWLAVAAVLAGIGLVVGRGVASPVTTLRAPSLLPTLYRRLAGW